MKGDKMKYLKISIIGVFIVGVCCVSAWAADSGWKKVGEKNGIVGYTRPTTRSSVDEMKADGMVEAPVAVIEAVIRDVLSQPEYMFRCKEAKIANIPEFKQSKDTSFFLNVTGMPYPLNDRDVFVRADYTVDKITGTLYVHMIGQNTTYMSDNKRVRMPVMEADYILVPKGPNKTEMTYVALAEPGGIPAFAVNLFCKNLTSSTIAGIRELVKKDKYKNAKEIVTTTPH
jgi:hypothetical protein